MSKVICVVQARSNSTRLPKKIFSKIGDINLLQWVDLRLSFSSMIDEVVYALPKSDEIFNVAQYILNGKVRYVEVDEDDVLSRYYNVALEFNADIVVRVTADCPFIEPKIVDQVISKFLNDGETYLSNTNPPTFPDGLDVEVMSFDVLKEAYDEAISSTDREHVTPYIIRKHAKNNFVSEVDLSAARLTVDDPDDLIRCNEVFLRLNNYNFDYNEIIELWRKEPAKLSSNTKRNEGAVMTNGYKMWARAKKSILGGNMLLSKRPEMFAPNVWPPYFKSAVGISVTDIDDRVFKDFSLMGVGTNLLGYSRPEVVSKVSEVIQQSNMSTLNCPEEVHLAEKLIEMHPWAGMAKFARSGGEANAIAIRIARASQKRDKVAICGYHGWHDWYLSVNLKKDQLGEHLLKGLSTNGLPKQYSGLTEAFRYGDAEKCEELLSTEQFSCVIMEVSRFDQPDADFVRNVREICNKTNTLLIFDECTSGFRQYFGGLHMTLDVHPDICMFGKALGNGHPITAVLGRREVMLGAEESFISSTFWTDRVGPVAALETLKIFEAEKTWLDVSRKGKYIKNKWKEAAELANLEIEISGLDPLAAFKFDNEKSNQLKTIFIQKMLNKGYLASTSVYVSSAHSYEEIDQYFENCVNVFKEISEALTMDKIDDILIAEEAHTGFERLN